MKIGKLEAIFWQDAYVTTDDRPEFKEEHLTISVGHAVKEDKGMVYVSHFYDGIGSNWESPWTAIPKAWIKRRVVLHTKGGKNG